VGRDAQGHRKQINDVLITDTEYEVPSSDLASAGITDEDTVLLEGLVDVGGGATAVEELERDLCYPGQTSCDETERGGGGDDPRPPLPPYNIVADNITIPGSPSQPGVYVAWTPGASPGDEYLVYRASLEGLESCGEGTFELIGITTSTSYEDYTVQENAMYGYRIQARLLEGTTSDMSACRMVYTRADALLPPGRLYVENQSSYKIGHLAVLEWSGPDLQGNFAYGIFRAYEASQPGLWDCDDFSAFPQLATSQEATYRDLDFPDPNPLVAYKVAYVHVPTGTVFPLSDCVVTHVGACATKPATPMSLSGLYNELNQSVDLTWSPVSCSGCAIEYWVYKGNPTLEGEVFYGTTSDTAFSIPFVLPTGGSETFAVVAVDQNTGCRSVPKITVVEGPPGEPCVPPEAPTGILGYFDGTRVNLFWNYMPGVTYEVVRADGPCGTAYTHSWNAETNSYQDEVAGSGTFAYAVRAVSVEECVSENSSCFSITVPAPPAAPGEPNDPVVDGNTVYLSWPLVAEAEGYYVYRFIGACGTPDPSARCGFVRGTSFVDSIPPAVTRYYRVTAVNEYGQESGPSPCKSAKAETMSWTDVGAEPTIEYLVWDHLGTTRLILDVWGVLDSEHDYAPFGTELPPYYNPSGNRHQFTGHERDHSTGLDYMHNRYYGSSLGRFLSPDVIGGSPANPQSWNKYGYASNNPVGRVDEDGLKDKPFDQKTDKPVTEDASTRTPMKVQDSKGNMVYNPAAYNCHSYAWHNSKGDPRDPGNKALVSEGVKKWDQSPSDDLKKHVQLDPNADNMVGDKVIYYHDADGNGQYDPGEPIDHSANVTAVDSAGNTTEVTGKMGQLGISVNHPNAPGYYPTHTDPNTGASVGPTSRAYFRDKKTEKKRKKEEEKLKKQQGSNP